MPFTLSLTFNIAIVTEHYTIGDTIVTTLLLSVVTTESTIKQPIIAFKANIKTLQRKHISVIKYTPRIPAKPCPTN